MGWLSKQRADGDLVSHRAGKQEESCFLATHFSHVGFESGGCVIFAVGIVEEGGILDGLEH